MHITISIINLHVRLSQCQGILAKVLFLQMYEPLEFYLTKSPFGLYYLYKPQIAESKQKQDVPKCIHVVK